MSGANQQDRPTLDQLDQEAVARRLGVARGTVQRYRSADRDKYRFPDPDGYLGRSPWWWPATIDEWIAARPGKGAGAGRPRKHALPPTSASNPRPTTGTGRQRRATAG